MLGNQNEEYERDHLRDIEENKLMDDIDKNYDPNRRSITDGEWTTNAKKWDKAKNRWLTEVINGVIWNNEVPIEEFAEHDGKIPFASELQVRDDTSEMGIGTSEVATAASEAPSEAPSEMLGEDDSDPAAPAPPPVTVPAEGSKHLQMQIPPMSVGTAMTVVAASDYSASLASDDNVIKELAKEIVVDEAAVLDSRAAPQPFLKKHLWAYLDNWDKACAGKRDRIIWEFLKVYTWKHPIDMEYLFCCGGSLIFMRFTVGLQMAYMKRQRVPHYFMALKIFIRSLQGAEYTMQFASMGAIMFIFEIVRVAETVEYDKKQALKFLLELMEGANGPGIKYFICSVPHYLESLVDFLTMCHNTSVVFQCRKVFEVLCMGNTMSNICLVSKFVMAMLPCDFNPKIQALSFRVLQGIVRVNHEMAKLCLKPLQDNFKTDDPSLIVEMGELVMVIMNTPDADAMVEILIASATGIRLKEEFESWDRLYRYRPSSAGRKKFKYKTKLQVGTREAWEKSMAKKNRKDNYHQQSGALFILNHILRNRPDLTHKLIRHGIYGISLKSVGASPHWQVQTQGIKLMILLNELSKDCSISYFLMIPQTMMECIIKTSEDCLKLFTSPICLYFRKLGRFSLRMWHDWVQKVVIPTKAMYKAPAKSSAKGLQIDGVIAKRVEEIYLELKKIWDSPILEAARSAFVDADDETDLKFGEMSPSPSQEDPFKVGRKQIMNDSKLEAFKRYLDKHHLMVTEFHDDILDSRIDAQFLAVARKDDTNDRDFPTSDKAGGLQEAETAMQKIMHAIEDDVPSGEEEEEATDHDSYHSTSDAFHI